MTANNASTSRSEGLLNKVYDRLDAIDVNELSLRELQDFLEVVQRGRFLETIGKTSPFFGNAFGCASTATETETGVNE